MKYIVCSSIVLLFLSWAVPTNKLPQVQIQKSASIDAGRNFFYSNCTSCHAVFKNLTGPALVGADRRITKEMYYAIVANPRLAIKKYPYFKNQLKHWQVLMSAFPGLKREDVDSIIEFVKAAEKNPKLDYNPTPVKKRNP